MSSVIEKLALRNLERYRRVELDFSAGLNLVKGRNSTGKTTLLNALTFALFGETPEARPRLLVSKLPGASSMAVYVRFRSPKNGRVVEIERRGGLYRNGDYRTETRSLKVDDKDISVDSEEDLRAKVTELLGISIRKFLSLVYVRQGRLGEILEPQKEQMDSVMGITLLRELREQLDEARRELERFEGRDVATEIHSLEERIPELDSNLKQVEEDVNRVREEVQRIKGVLEKAESPELTELLKYIERKKEVEDELRKLEDKTRELLENVNASSLEDLEAKISFCEKDREILNKTRGTLKEEVGNLLNKWSRVRGIVENLRKNIYEHESLLEKGVSKCPTCGQDFQPSVLQKMLNEDRNTLARLELEESEAKSDHESKNSELQKVLEKINSTEGEISRMNSARSRLKEYLNSFEKYSGIRREVVDTVRVKLNSLSLSFNPEDPDLKLKLAQQLPIHPDELTKKKRELAEKEENLKRRTLAMEETSRKLEDFRKMLEKLRQRMKTAGLARTLSQAFDQTVETRRRELLKRIEFRALEYYRAMTDQHVYDAITIDPENYSVMIHPKGLTDSIPANRVGGGHQTIISLALRLALLDSLGLRFLLILDEPTYGVDSENLPQVANYLGEVSRQLSQMILVTHYNICEEEASNIIEVAVQEDGSSKAEIKT